MMPIRRASRHGFLLALPPRETIETFRNSHYEPGWIPEGSRVYRYGSDPSQARWSRGAWVNLTTDLFEVAGEALERCALLDATMITLQYDPRNNKPGAIWNTAAWRATLIAKQDVPVYVGIAAPMAFDLSTGKRYRGRGDQRIHRIYQGGAVQLVTGRGEFDKFDWMVPPVPMKWTQWAGHH